MITCPVCKNTGDILIMLGELAWCPCGCVFDNENNVFERREGSKFQAHETLRQPFRTGVHPSISIFHSELYCTKGKFNGDTSKCQKQ